MADFGTSTNFRPVLPETALVSGRAINLTVSGPQTLWLGCDLSINLPTDALPVGSNLSVRGGTRSLARFCLPASAPWDGLSKSSQACDPATPWRSYCATTRPWLPASE